MNNHGNKSLKHGGRTLTIVIKLGTSSIVHEKTHQPLISLLSSLVETVVRLRSSGHRVVLVSSGAIGVGLKRMDMKEKPKHLAGKQALAAIGQGRLIALWDNLFGQLGQPIAQILLTRGDISDRSRYLNAVSTLTELLTMGVIPIINENDTVSVSEIKFGDNDTLSAVTCSMLHADYLFLLTDVDSLYTSNPRKDPDAKPIEVVTSISEVRKRVSTATLGSNLGTGGMETKLIAAEIATAAGVSVIITSSKKVENILDIIQYNIKSLPPPIPSTLDSPSIPATDSPGEPVDAQPNNRPLTRLNSPSVTNPSTPIRPPHTLFKPSLIPLNDLKSWTAHTLYPAGSVIIDSGAHNVLSRRESGGRLLAVGVISVIGKFAAGQAVRIVIGKPKGTVIIATTSAKVASEQGSAEKTITTEVTTDSPVMTSFPPTPLLVPSKSHASSISSLDALSPIGSVGEMLFRPVPPVPLGSVGEELAGNAGSARRFFVGDDDPDNWEVVEVGRGLANYNSEDLMKVRGVKSSEIRKILGYADSEYVVENVTIRVPPIS